MSRNMHLLLLLLLLLLFVNLAHLPVAVDDSMLRALTAVFGMEANGRINKEKARQVVEKLGLLHLYQHQPHQHQTTTSTSTCGFDELFHNFDGDGLDSDGEDHRVAVPVEEVLGLGGGFIEFEDGIGPKRIELLRQAFKIFDEDGNGYIDALELKRVLQCLFLDNGWDMDQIHTMLKVVDLNLDGKVDFTEFQVMMT